MRTVRACMPSGNVTRPPGPTKSFLCPATCAFVRMRARSGPPGDGSRCTRNAVDACRHRAVAATFFCVGGASLAVSPRVSTWNRDGGGWAADATAVNDRSIAPARTPTNKRYRERSTGAPKADCVPDICTELAGSSFASFNEV